MLIQDYASKVLPSVQKELGLKSVMQVPRLKKITINCGVGSYVTKKSKDYNVIVDHLTAISGQKPVVVQARKSISNFKLREGTANGIMVTLRGKRMLDFLDRLVNVVLPRTRDFRGVSKRSFDKRGNYSMGVKEVTVFPEVRIDDMSKLYGLQINFSIDAQEKEHAQALLKAMGIPFQH